MPTSRPQASPPDQASPRLPATHGQALLMLALAAVFWSLGGVLVKGIAWNALAISGTRSLIAAAVIALWYRRRLRFTFSKWQIAGALAYAGTVILFVLATKLTTAANAILLQYTAPIHIALIAPWLLGEPNHPRDWAAIFVTLAGIGLFFLDQLSSAGALGNLLGLGAGFCFALLAVFLRKQKEGSPIESIVLGNAIAALVGLPFMRAPFPDTQGWLLLGLLGAVQLGIAYIIYAAAIRRATAMDAALVPMIEPILNPVWVALGVGEVPGPYALLGGAIVLGTLSLRGVLAVRARRPGVRGGR